MASDKPINSRLDAIVAMRDYARSAAPQVLAGKVESLYVNEGVFVYSTPSITAAAQLYDKLYDFILKDAIERGIVCVGEATSAEGDVR
jgi:hypothetical protein